MYTARLPRGESSRKQPTSISSLSQSRLEEVELLLSQDFVPPDAISQLDSELALLEDFTRRIKARKNDSQPISRLPPELIGEIIQLVAQQERPRRPCVRYLNLPSLSINVHVGTLPTRSEIGWIRLAAVCHRWRRIVLNKASLWADSICTLAGAEGTMLGRARDAPLTLRLDTRRHAYSERTVGFVQEQLFRARVIEIHERPGHSAVSVWPEGTHALAGRSFPQLETLILDLKFTGSLPVSTPPTVPIPMYAPRLQHLELRDIFVPWTSAPNLTEISLIRSDKSTMMTPPLARLLHLLQSSPHLRSLELHGYLPEAKPLVFDESGNATGDDIIVSLPVLRELSITSETSRALAFWTHLIIPPSADVRLRLDPTHTIPIPPQMGAQVLLQPKRDSRRFELLRALGRQFAPALAAGADRPISGVSVFDFPDEESLRFCLFTPDEGQINVGQDAVWTGPFARDYSFRLDVQFCRWPTSATLFVETLESILGAFDFRAVETFELMSTKPGASARWQNVLASVRSPAIVSLDGMPNAQLLDALSPQIMPPRRGEGGMRVSRMLFPHLRMLYLSASAHTDGWLSSLGAQGDVIDMLQHRLLAGAAVDTLVLDEQALAALPEQAKDFLDCLRKLVPNVEIRDKILFRPSTPPADDMPWAETALLLNAPVVTP
ncbi:hypothetical protein PENSPDRAFT_755798 [Peniophora sp. CONT]|nr:hypothetical protein PENSPDRAFT_755798 [Peniophora sp. CONT]